MLTVKTLKPYYIKADPDCVRLVLGYQYFAIFINEEEYQFIPIEAKEIKINRKTRKIENIEAKFAFQKGKEVIYIMMNELIYHPDFMIHLYEIANPYYTKDLNENRQEKNDETAIVIDELEQLNIKRMIDKALDERNQDAFEKLVHLL